ncbi:MAG: zf-TFIIB domain-containing protein [Deltaproteobacteria bacterium]|nr:zf-TFIIB domain-containing protein [Deltaproteobacteria bacterium]
MNCPRCGVDLVQTSKGDVVIDVCPTCNGIWLDRGELGKILNEFKRVDTALDEELSYARKARYFDDDHYERYKHKKHSFMKKIFDIFD